VAQRIAHFLHLDLSPEQVVERWHQALDADNKTKSDDVKLAYTRESLWSDKANALYDSLGFTEIAAYLGY
jgi:nuclear transport factor 2 (NTF2) superfamily protein